MPNNWCWTRLNNYLDVRDGTHDTPKYVEKGFPLITSKNLQKGTIDFSTAKFISQEDYEYINSRSYVDNGDILFAMIGSIGNPVKAVKDRPFAIKNMALFKAFSNLTNMDFLYLFLLNEQENMKKEASGGVQSFVSLNFLRNYLMPLPPLAEQQHIVAKINEIFAKL